VSRSTVSEQEIAAPSEMFTIADSRTLINEMTPHGLVEQLHGEMQMQAFNHFHEETDPIHGEGYNILFADGHVTLVKRKQYLYPPVAAHHWNRDNQPHPEAWRPTNIWAVQN
jgi:prepilin-type processing-associated H-X9-DG protein